MHYRMFAIMRVYRLEIIKDRRENVNF